MKFKLKILLLTIFLLTTTIKTNEETPEDENNAEDPAEAENANNEAPEDENGEEETEDSEKTTKKTNKQEDSENTPAPIPCNQELLETFGMEGVENAHQDFLEMCPTIKNSCCSIPDQLIIYKNWEELEQGKNIDFRFKYHQDIYFLLLDNLDEVYLKANALLKKLEEEEDSNCKVMAKRVKDFNLPVVVERLKEGFKEMHEFFKFSYEGFYCSLCDVENHKFISTGKKTVTFSQKFCRDVTAKSIHVLLYFHVHLPNLLNLISRFTSSCNSAGVFIEKSIEPDFLFTTASENSNMLKQCKQFRNSPNWFEYCGKICNNFHFTKFNEFFQPNIKKFKSYTVFLQENIKKMEGGPQEAPIETKEEEKTTPPNGRLLSEDAKIKDTGKNAKSTENKNSEKSENSEDEEKTETVEPEEEEEEMDPEKKWENMEIFKTVLNSVIPIDEFISHFSDPGINLFDNGKLSLINDTTFSIVKNQIKKMKEAGGDEGDVAGDGDGKGGDGESWAGVYDFTLFMLIFTLFLS